MGWPLPVSLVLALLLAAPLARMALRARYALLGGVLVFAALVLYRVTPRGVLDLSIGIVLGVGLGAVVGAAKAIAKRRRVTTRGPRRAVVIVAAGFVWATSLVLWVGANDPTVQWFGHVITHGSRDDHRVAITFDDGPDDPYTLKVSAILDSHDVKGTFFEVGKAIDARPDIVKALYEDGHLLGNHSYHHDYWRWLDPRYPELDRTEDAFRRQLDVCPAFFRPPHGQRTPFMLAHASGKDMHSVTWDVSASDWTLHDGAEVAKRVLDHVQPGSIILLHDGLDGNTTADRSVILDALPRILDGLKAKGLQPVRLDQLLGLDGYLPSC